MTEFPTFHCLINDKDEPYDSDIQLFFTGNYSLASRLSILSKIDGEYRENYLKILDLLEKIQNYIITGESKPDYKFLNEIENEKGWKDDYKILKSGNTAAITAFQGCLDAVNTMYYYERLSRKDDYMHRFTPDLFNAYLLIRHILYKRASNLIKA
ncbi:hypothetical protein [Picrophilus oshimae]|uniref:Uncharacterized protein n=1 Tax=Picrophilus torridus (strain ATCC 700027 / DSM 9790 / JCM 10055 / NBRC 100828 / KAW 2/3) TaxID=1122961 RepID=Q6KZK5_PICTO|nr:hypothetical protein [Picrophilus oshimae]AAT43847.1 hypothetical protein PTO1262 [Picrophilus oshimae DSM 9789]